MNKLGVVATCNAGGAGWWRPEYAEHFRGRLVVILPDNDAVGRKHAQQVAASLQGVAATVKIVDLPGVPAKGDVSDWLDAGGTEDGLLDLVKAASLWRPDPAADSTPVQERKKPAIPSFAPFPVDVLPAVVRDFTQQGAKALGCDESVYRPALTAGPCGGSGQ